MTIEEIKAEITRLEPETEAAWIEFEKLEAQAMPARDRWYALQTKIGKLRGALEVLEPDEPAKEKE